MMRNHGFSLIETLVFIVVMSVALAGIANMFYTNTQQSAAPLIRERTLMIAQGLMDEIIAKGWDENTPLGGGCVDNDGDPTILTDSCTQYCSVLNDTQCSRSKCTLTAPGNCDAAALISAGNIEEASRPLWDDVDDFNGYTASPAENIEGTSIAQYSDFTTSILITQPSWNAIPSTDVRRIQVRVTNPLGETIMLVSYKVNF